MRNYVLFIMLMLGTVSARAAELGFYAEPEFNVMVLVNEIVKGDFDKFERIANGLSGKTVVFLDSRGGGILEAMIIGESIRKRKFGTAVSKGDQCASACALIWLAGTTRFLSPDARLGFHAAYTGEGDGAKETGMGNALVGAYLHELDLSFEAIAFATSAPPNGMNWLHAAKAKELGIGVVALADNPAPNATPATQAATAPFAPMRLPVATASAASSTLLAAPVAPMSAAQQASTQTVGYAEGRQARLAYEQWFAGLVESPFTDGATFWAGNRSLTPMPTCERAPNAEWHAGCVASRARLATVDLRRKSEKDYWWGWNSL